MFNYDYLSASPLIVRQADSIDIWLIGAGGTGSWLSYHIARLARSLGKSGKKVQFAIADPDIVEEGNISRQAFCDKEIGLPKAQALALRYSIAWGVDATAFVQEFDPKLIRYAYDKLTILVGCVDTAAGRAAINQVLELNQFYSRSEIPRVWYLDCGNHAAAGQILLGSSLETDPEFYNFGGLGCARLPSPMLQAPDLLKPKPEELTNNLSCAEMAVLNLQSESVNVRVAAEAADYLYRMATGNLKRFATYFDLESGTARSLYITQQSVYALVKAIASEPITPC